MRTCSALGLISITFLAPACKLATILPWLETKYIFFSHARPLFSVRPTMMTLSTDLAALRASSTHWIMGLPATSTSALDSPCVAG